MDLGDRCGGSISWAESVFLDLGSPLAAHQSSASSKGDPHYRYSRKRDDESNRDNHKVLERIEILCIEPDVDQGSDQESGEGYDRPDYSPQDAFRPLLYLFHYQPPRAWSYLDKGLRVALGDKQEYRFPE